MHGVRRGGELRHTWSEGIHCNVEAKADKREDAQDYSDRQDHDDERCGSDTELFHVSSILLDWRAGSSQSAELMTWA
jgi:hypothetical protein